MSSTTASSSKVSFSSAVAGSQSHAAATSFSAWRVGRLVPIFLPVTSWSAM